MKVKLAQLVVTRSIQENLKKILEVLDSANQSEWVIFPEGILSGYFPEEDTFLQQLNFEDIQKGIETVRSKVKEKQCLCIFGTAYMSSNMWYNASIFIDGEKEIVYYKNNLATLDRKHFTQGNSLDVYEAHGVKFGIQMCRELVFPEQWKLLKHKGAQVIFHINNSIKEADKVREHMLLSRAFENQYFVCSVNNADKPQTMASFVISPIGEILFDSRPQEEVVKDIEIELGDVQNTYIQQERSDLVKVTSY